MSGMQIVRKREGQAPENMFIESALEPASSSVEISVNAKGLYQYTLKLYVPSDADLLDVVNRMRAFDVHFRAQFPVPVAPEV